MIFTGTGRCGTGYISQVCTRAGIPIAHEGFFRPGCYGDFSEWLSSNHYRGDSSWLALAFADRRVGPIFHVVRDPRDVWRSLVGMAFFTDPRHDSYSSIAMGLMDCHRLGANVLSPPSRWHECRLATEWISTVHGWLSRVPRVHVDQPESVHSMLIEIGAEPNDAFSAIRNTPINYNSNRLHRTNIEPPTPIQNLAEDLGYAE